jgi:hypothetical protein
VLWQHHSPEIFGGFLILFIRFGAHNKKSHFMDYDSSEFFLIILVVLVIFLIPTIFYLVTLQRTLEAISIENRKMPPGQVWLLLIPLFNLVWQFIVVSNIAESIAAECQKLSIPANEPKPTNGIGMAKNILGLCGIIPLLGVVCSLASLVCWIIYWVKVAEYKNLIMANKGNEMLDAERGIFHGNPTL